MTEEIVPLKGRGRLLPAVPNGRLLGKEAKMKLVFILLMLTIVLNFYGMYGIYTVGTSLFTGTQFERPTLFGLLKTDKKVPASTVQEKLISATVTADALNVREGPGADNALITTLHKGDKLTILEEYDGTTWVKIEYKGRTGFVHGDYITREKGK
jgi:uncharacterized protein YgiM (DUF1202 family)